MKRPFPNGCSFPSGCNSLTKGNGFILVSKILPGVIPVSPKVVIAIKAGADLRSELLALCMTAHWRTGCLLPVL
jgi:hypothetical protein